MKQLQSQTHDRLGLLFVDSSKIPPGYAGGEKIASSEEWI